MRGHASAFVGARAARLVLLLVGLLGLAGASATGTSAACPNEAFRAGAGSQLPDCRAYEQVSPVDKNNGDVTYGPSGASAQPMTASPITPSGNRVSFNSFTSFAGNPSAQLLNQYLSRRGPEGWSTAGISPPRTAPYGGVPVDTRSTFVGFSRDLTRTAVVGWLAPGQFSLMRRDTDGSFETVADGSTGTQPVFSGASSDFSTIVYQGAENTPGSGIIYEWTDGVSTPISIPPGGTTPVGAEPGEEANGFGPGWGRLMSDDGSRIFWKAATSLPGTDAIYLYEDGASTEISASQCTTGEVGEPGPGGNCVPPGTSAGIPEFQTASRDGSLALFVSGSELTNDSVQSRNLFRYDADSGVLANLTPYSADHPNGADVMGVLGASDDLSHVYFAANGVLASGATAPTTPCVSSGVGARTCNLYLWHEGEFTFVAGLSQGDLPAWDPRRKPKEHSLLAQTSADGRHLLFTSTTPTSQVIPGSTYDNAGRREAYLFDADTDEVRCVSCDPSEGSSSQNSELGQQQGGMPNAFALYQNMTEDGNRVFFETTAPLLARDTNGARDVYEWRAEGTGDCESAAANGGCLDLISTGRAAGPSFFQNTTPSGDDVLFSTRQQLVGQDVDQLVDLYDARVGGGLAGQYPAPAPAPCLSEACRPAAPAPSPPPLIGSSSFAGPGDPTPIRRRSKKKAGCKKAKETTRGKARKGKCLRRKPRATAKRRPTGKRG